MMKQSCVFAAFASLLSLSLSGCAVGPHFHAPESPAIDFYTASPLPSRTESAPVSGGTSQRFAFGRELSAGWWELFRSPALDAWIRQGLAENPSLSAARAALRAARENLRAAGGALLYPSIDGGFQAARQRTSGNALSGPSSEFNLYNASVNVSYLVDLFGGARRRLEALQAQVDFQGYRFEAAYLALTANIVTTAVKEGALRGQIEATHEIIASEEKMLDLVKRRFELGAVPKSSVLSQQSQLAATKATLPPLERELAYARHALSALVGQLPSEANLPAFQLDSLALPGVLPVSVPSKLARQRPDIRMSEALLHQACAEVGVATANLYPQITLSGGYGVQSVSAGLLFTGQSVIWNLAGGLLQPIFHGGELTAKRRAAIALYDQAEAQYRETVLGAFQNVADVLRALETDARGLRAQAEAAAAAEANLDLTQRQFELGAVSYLSLLVAQRDCQQARLALIAAEANRYADTAALFQALGGGWWKRESAPFDLAAAQKQNSGDRQTAKPAADRLEEEN